jgi:hypothetical protein
MTSDNDVIMYCHGNSASRALPRSARCAVGELAVPPPSVDRESPATMEEKDVRDYLSNKQLPRLFEVRPIAILRVCRRC